VRLVFPAPLRADATGQEERIEVDTTLLRDHEPVFRRVVSSLQFAR
jgi:hypothetical protein